MILVVGSTGHLGSEIVRLLRERGESVRGLVRSTSAPENVARLREMGAETTVGNLRDRASLDAAVHGARTVISTVSIIRTAQEGDSFEDTDAAGNISLIDAAKAVGAEHFIFVSFDGAAFPDTPLFKAKRAVDTYLRSSGMGYTILHPPPFMEVWLGPMLFGDPSAGPVKVYGPGDRKVPYISMYDVARVAVYAATNPSARNKTIAFGGPEGITQRDVVRTFEQALGKSLDVTEVPEQALEAQWKSAQNPFEKTFAGLMLGIARLDADPPPNPDLPIKTTVREFAKTRAAAPS
jgi:uncharacterized protein YbjT (DUF2867 family)